MTCTMFLRNTLLEMTLAATHEAAKLAPRFITSTEEGPAAMTSPVEAAVVAI